MRKRYTWADVAGVLGKVFAPVGEAVRAETGRTVGELVAAGRRVAAGVLRRLADAIAGVPAAVPGTDSTPAVLPAPTPPVVPAPCVAAEGTPSPKPPLPQPAARSAAVKPKR